MTVRCIVCGSGASRILEGPPAIAGCGACGLMFLESVPSAAEREGFYQETYYREDSGGRFLPVFERLVTLFRRLRMRAILEKRAGPGAFLDVGCGRGILLSLFAHRGWSAVGTQLSRTAAEAARRRYGVDVRLGELPELELRKASFDVVAMYHVLEHLERPDVYLREARDLLRDDGLLVVEVPDHGGPGFRLLGTRHFCVDYPNHIVFFTRETLTDLVTRCGFRVECVQGFSLEYSPYTTLQNMLNVLPGEPSRLYRALGSGAEGRRLRRHPATWIHAFLAVLLGFPAVLLSLTAVVLPWGNTVRLYARKEGGKPPGNG